MKIDQSAVAMNASHEFSTEYEVSYTSTSSFRTVFDGVSQAENSSPSVETGREIGREIGREAGRDAQVLVMLEALIARMLEFISGKRDSPVTDLRDVLGTGGAFVADTDGSRPRQTLEMEWTSEFTETIREHERTEFSASGKVKTADGRSLDFSIELAMCRDFACERKVKTVDKVVLRDPLVINFDGKAAELSGTRFEFDLNADGASESIPGLGTASAYLAFDGNADGHINDGSELFGTRSGNGFADLAKLDADGNLWLDESEAAFASLLVWQRDAAGRDTLSSLRDKGVGALYLGSVETPFALTDGDNRSLAQIRASGFYLREDGGAGSLQQIDLAV